MPPLRGPGGQFVSAAAVAEAGSPYITLDTNARAVAARMELAAVLVPTHMTTALAESVAIIREGIKKNFETEGAYFGERWQELAERTIMNKAAKGHGGNQMLVDEGNLERTLTDDYGITVTPLGTETRIGTDDWRAHFFQQGTDKMPAREIVGVSTRDTAAIFLLFEAAMTAALAEAGL